MSNEGMTEALSLDVIESSLAAVLKPSRFRHTQGVRYTACALAMAHGGDVEKAALAGLLHDCAKYLSDDALKDICSEKGLSCREVELLNPALLHAKVGAYLARERYGVQDPDVLQAIEDHTTGRAGMPLLSEIVFVADFIEPHRKMIGCLPRVRKIAFEDLSLACYTILQEVGNYLEMTGKTVDERSKEALCYYASKQSGQAD